MKNNSSEISTHAFTPNDELLLDTNIWLSIYGFAKPGDHRSVIYSKALSEMLAANCRICVDVLILSEYVNAYARFRYNLLNTSAVFKNFRKGADFKPIAADIAGDVRQILKHCERIESDLPDVDIGELIDDFEKGDSDFNDQVLVELCKRRNLTLVTHDADFRDRGLTVLTANKNLLG